MEIGQIGLNEGKMTKDSVVIVSAKRTPLGAFQGQLSHHSATDLGSFAIKAAVESAGIDNGSIDEVFMGCVLPAGLGQAPARQAALKAGLTEDTPCTTVNKVCGSGMKAIMLACDQIMLGNTAIAIGGGLESMTNAPYLLDKARGGYRLGHGKTYDHMFLDGLEDAYDKATLMGSFAENTADSYNFTRQNQDDFAIDSGKRALEAQKHGYFVDEITAVPGTKKAPEPLDIDEPPSKVRFEKIPTLKPAFRENGTVTAANSSSITDGAAAVVMMLESEAKKQKLTPLARIHGHAMHAHQSQWFTTAPVEAIKKVVKQVSWSLDEVDLFEINEAFAVVTMAAMQDLKLPHEKVNVWGGACALGHPIGASGARLVVTLIHALKQRGEKKGIAALCIGGGEATAMAVECL